MVSALQSEPRAAVAFCSVAPAPHDASLGTIPHHYYRERRCIQSIRAYATSIGMSAGLAVRREALLTYGGFDEALGAGALYRSAEDHDLAIRLLMDGWGILEVPETEVLHDGFRTFAEFRVLTGRDWYGIGAAHTKQIRRRRLSILLLILYLGVGRTLVQPTLMIFCAERPRGYRRFPAYWKGFLVALRTPCDVETGNFVIEPRSA